MMVKTKVWLDASLMISLDKNGDKSKVSIYQGVLLLLPFVEEKSTYLEVTMEKTGYHQ